VQKYDNSCDFRTPDTSNEANHHERKRAKDLFFPYLRHLLFFEQSM
jgi:hypothetical protein